MDPQNGGVLFNIFAHFGAIFGGVFRLPSATDVVFLHACWLKLVHGLCWSSVSNNSTALCRRGTVVVAVVELAAVGTVTLLAGRTNTVKTFAVFKTLTKPYVAFTGFDHKVLRGFSRLSRPSLKEFPNQDWPAIEHWAEKELLKPDVWKARRTNLSLIVKLEIPISGTAIQVQQQALKLDQVPDSWPCNLESGWAAHYGRLDMPFEAMCQHLVQNQFTSDAFQGNSDSYLFQWSTNVWDTWPDVEGQNFKEDWNKEGHINHPKRSETALTTEDIHQLQQDTPAHNELRAPMNQFMER